ncbi:hypothetical protein [Methanosalsum zhilinae]|uniref:hypothetical protein n=1 Tax=Methanosalsum zhilinae TaxID=39669 RepID=UPI0012F696C5|nr:hypothetical protein [Methanosalsum zhilinae]
MVAYYVVHKGPYFTGDDPFFNNYRTPDTADWAHVNRWLIPVQIIRGFLFSIVLYPILDVIDGLGASMIFLFIFGLMYVYTELASMVAGPCNLEGWIYFKSEKFSRGKFFCLKMHFEGIFYSLVIASLVSIFLF